MTVTEELSDEDLLNALGEGDAVGEKTQMARCVTVC